MTRDLRAQERPPKVEVNWRPAPEDTAGYRRLLKVSFESPGHETSRSVAASPTSTPPLQQRSEQDGAAAAPALAPVVLDGEDAAPHQIRPGASGRAGHHQSYIGGAAPASATRGGARRAST